MNNGKKVATLQLEELKWISDNLESRMKDYTQLKDWKNIIERWIKNNGLILLIIDRYLTIK